MKCPRCGCKSSVLASGEADHGAQFRKRECVNKHRFTTYEVYEPVARSAAKQIASAGRAAQAAAERWLRDLRIIASKATLHARAQEFGLTRTRIQQILAAASATHPTFARTDNPPVGSSDAQPQKGNDK